MPQSRVLETLGRHVASMLAADALPLPPGLAHVPLHLDALDALPVPVLVAIFEGPAASPEAIRAACEAPRIAHVPIVVIAPCRLHAAYRRVLPRAEILALPRDPTSSADVAHRLGLLSELGAARLGLELFECAIAEGVTGVTIAEVRDGAVPLVYASPSFERVTGHPAEEVIGRDSRFVFADDSDPSAQAALGDAAREQRRAQVVVRNTRKDGTPFWNEVTLFPLEARGVPLPFVGGVQHDVTELVNARARVEQLVVETSRRAAFEQAVLDALEAGVLTADDEGRVSFVNSAARELTGLDPLGLRMRDVLGTDVDPAELLAGRSTVTLTQRRSVGGVERDIETTIREVPGAVQGLSLVVLLRDVTHELRLHEELRRVERLAAMGTMVAGFAHEVRNPVASLRAIAEQLDEDLAELGLALPHATRMLKVLARIEVLVDTSLRFGRPTSPRRRAVRPWELLAAALSALQPRTRARGDDIRVEVEPELPSLFVDDGQVGQVLVILLENALDAVQSPRQVLCRACTSSGEGGVRLEVVDQGPGIPASVIGRIFDPFFTTKPSGTGLGLSIAQQLVSENGGRMEVSSAVGGPTTFALSFDAAKDSSGERP